MRAALDRAGSGSGSTVLVAGEAGIGKSALLRGAFGGRTGVVQGRATPPPAPTLRPLVELALGLVQRGARLDGDGVRLHAAALGTLLAGRAPEPGRAEPPGPIHLAEALLALCALPGVGRPDALVVEDLHWADAESLAAVEYLADRMRRTPMALVVTLRPEGDAWALVRRLARRPGVDLITLGPLDAGGVRDLVADCLRADPPADLLAVLDRAEGVPLVIEELLATFHRRGDLTHAEAGWRFRPGVTPVVPPSVNANVAERVAQLDRDQRRILDAAALLGRDFDMALLAAGVTASPAEVDGALAAARELGLLTPDPDSGRLRFSHALVRDATLDVAGAAGLADTAHRLLDALVSADLLVAQGGLELASRLAVAANDHARAGDLLGQAGRAALDHGFPSAAVRLLDQALGLVPPGEGALVLREALLQALSVAGDAARAEAVGETVRRQLAAIGATASRRDDCTIAIARAAANAGRWEEADALLSPLLGQGGSADARGLGARVAFAAGRFADAERHASTALEDARAAPAVACESAEILGRLARRSDLIEARTWFERAAATAELHGLGLWRARALHELATIDQLRTLATGPLEEARVAAIDAGAPGLLAAVEFHLAAVRGVRFETEAALVAARRCLDTARRLGAVHQEAWAWNLIAQAHAAGGDRTRARAAAEEAIALEPDDPEIAGVAVGTGLGLASLVANDRSRAVSQWADAIKSLRSLPVVTPLPPWYLWPLLSTALDLEGDGGERARAETDTGDLRVATGPDGLWHLAGAVAAGRRGDAGAAGEAADRAAASFSAIPAFAGYIHLGRFVAAEAAIADGWGEPAAWMSEASAWAAGRGLRELGQACAALGRRAGAPQRRRGRGESSVPARLGRLGVTSREMDVLLLVAEGLTNREIADRLYLSLRTVKGHVENLLAKLGATNRTQLAGQVAQPPG